MIWNPYSWQHELSTSIRKSVNPPSDVSCFHPYIFHGEHLRARYTASKKNGQSAKMGDPIPSHSASPFCYHILWDLMFMSAEKPQGDRILKGETTRGGYLVGHQGAKEDRERKTPSSVFEYHTMLVRDVSVECPYTIGRFHIGKKKVSR